MKHAPFTPPKALEAEVLCHRCNPDQFDFGNTTELADLTEIIGQGRALEAIQFGTDIRRQGYNLFVLGSPGMGRHTVVQQFLEKKAAAEETPPDWCYVNNFSQAHKPRALKLPTGKGVILKRDMELLVEELKVSIPAAFDSDEYRAKAEKIQKEYNDRQENAFKTLGDKAEKQGIALLRTPSGFAFAPMKNGEVINPEEYEKLADDEKQRVEQVISDSQENLQKIIRRFPLWRKEQREKIKLLTRTFTLSAVSHLIDELAEKYADLPGVINYLEAVKQDVLDNENDFRKKEDMTGNAIGMQVVERPSLRRYEVNVVIDHGESHGAPIVLDDYPMVNNLIGRVEHIAQMGALVTDFMLIKPGSLHRANGGYLLLDVYKLLEQPYAWDALKRALYARQVKIESLGQMLSLVSTVSLEPEPIPLDVKIILFGERSYYYLLQEDDPEFDALFKVAADFEEELDRDETNSILFARLIATLARREALQPLDRSAVAKVIEHSARLVEDAEKLTTHIESVADLLREADYWAGKASRQITSAADIQQAIDAQTRRADRVKHRIHEDILRGTVLIDTQGAVVGQANGLSVIELGNFAFAEPVRITATTRLGEGEMINIEREVELSGAIHSKGVLILTSFLAARFSRNRPLSLSASLTFEQSYGTIDGDSASLAELCALLSNLADTPIKQALAVTGSVNQFGQVQAIGSVNEKIEGFFDICRARGLTGEQGVLIPASNVKHLMLHHDVVQAAAEGKFHIYPIETVDQAIALLTGGSAGEPDAQGNLPAGCINNLVATRLFELSVIRQALSGGEKSKHVRKTTKRRL